MSFIKELKRRNVFRVAIAYVIVAWLVLQIGDALAPALRLPDWVNTLLAFFLILGFPMALFFAWAFELTPDGIKKEKHVVRTESITHITGRKLDFIIIVVMALAIGYFAYDEFVIEPAQEDALATDSAQEIVATEVQQSIAVLPFVNMSDDPGNEYFSDGLSEEILNLLAKISDLKIIARTSSFAFKGKNEDVRVIGNALGVKTVLEGSVRKSGERVRITAQLVDVSDGAHIWSETYDRTMTDIFAVQDDVAAAIIDALKLHVGAIPTRGRPTENTAAYALFLKARALLNAGESREAVEVLLNVVELDPEFAEAYELLAYSYWTATDGRFADAAKVQKLMGEAAAGALAIDPDLVFAQALYQSGSTETYSLLGAIQASERVVREQPNNTAVLFVLSYDLGLAGYFRESLSYADRWVDLDPLSPQATDQWLHTLYAVGRTSEAMAAMEVLDQLDPEGTFAANAHIGDAHLVDKRDEAAIASYEALFRQLDIDLSWIRELITGARDPATGLEHLDEHIPLIFSSIVASAPEEDASFSQQGFFNKQMRHITFYLFFGFLDRYFELILATDFDNSAWSDVETLVWQGTMNRRLGFTAHPKYLEVADSLGIIDVWEQRGPPDFCENVGGQWVCE
jgi:TolB-like protein